MRTEEGPAQVQGNESVEARTQARRRLLRGSFAAPAVLSLSSGSVFAYSVNCLAKAPKSIDNPTDGNFSTSRYSALDASGTVVKVVKGDDVRVKAAAEGFNHGKYGGSSSGAWVLLSGSDATLKSGTTPTMDNVRLALRFENTGSEQLPVYTVTGLGESSTVMYGGTEARVMSTSCWSSIKPKP